MSDQLPFEVTEQILLKIPARLLLRLTLVCKQWRSLISDPIFVKNHANYVSLDQSNRHRKLITHWAKHDDDVHSIVSQSIDNESLSSTNFELKFQTSIKPTVLGSCNGLLLLGTFNFKRSEFDTRLLWNPLLSEKYRLLPTCISGLSHCASLHGFGYATSIDDYKVAILKFGLLTSYRTVRVEVYSLKTNSWKIISDFPRIKFLFTNSNSNMYRAGTWVHDSIYWAVRDKVRISVVICFDLVTEKFKLIEPPLGDDKVYRPKPVNLVNVRGYLGGYWSEENADETVIWIWNEDENKKRFWTKLLKIQIENQIVKQILSFMNTNDVLLQMTGPVSQKLVIYDSQNMKTRDVPCGNYKWPMHMVETLVSPISS